MTTTTATTPSANTAVKSATQSLLKSLDSGSGVDTSTLVTSLVEAQYASRTARLTAKSETLTAQISGIATMKSAITGFATALDTLARSGSLATAPVSGDASVFTATATPGAKLSKLSSSITVQRLAAAQTAATGPVTSATTPTTRTTVLGSGSFTLQLGSAAYADGAMTDFTPSSDPTGSVSFDLTDASVDSIAAAINAKGAALGISASVVTGADGTPFLSLKGATGAAKAFTMSVTGDAGLAQFAVGKDAPTRIAATAQNAALTVDGVSVERTTNSIDDLVAGVKLQLTGVSTKPVTLTATKPTAGLTQAMNDIVDTYNTVVALITEQTDPVKGTLRTDPAAAALLRSLRALTLTSLNPAGGAGEPRTLSELGVRTARDGTLSVDPNVLSATLARNPDAVETMFASSAASATGLPAILKAMSAAATSTTAGLGVSVTRYTAAQADVADEQAAIVSQSEAMTSRLTQQFASMNSRVTAYKSIQTFLTNQIAAWNKSDS